MSEAFFPVQQVTIEKKKKKKKRAGRSIVPKGAFKRASRFYNKKKIVFFPFASASL